MSKALTRRTGIAYEAFNRGEAANNAKAYTERLNVDAAGISVKVARITLGDRCIGLGLVASSGVAMGTQKSAEAILRLPTTTEGPNLK